LECTRFVRLSLERLEDRTAPATVVGAGGGGDGTSWEDPRNWSNGFTPEESDGIANIPGGFNVQLNAPTGVSITTLNVSGNCSLTLNAPLTVGGGGTTGTNSPTLTLNSPMQTAGINFTGVLSVNTSLTVDGGASNTIGGFATVLGSLNANGVGVSLLGLGTLGGTVSGGVITFAPGSAWEVLAGGSFTGGQFNVNSGLTVDGNLGPTGGTTITLDADGATTFGSITGPGHLELWQAFNWDGGALGLAGGVTVNLPCQFTAATGEAKELSGPLSNVSVNTVLGGSGALTLDPGATFTNGSGIVTVSLPLITGGGTLVNDAFLKETGSTGVLSSFTSTATNSEVQVVGGAALRLSGNGGGTHLLGGVLQLDGNLNIVGVYTAAAGLYEDAGTGALVVLRMGRLDVPAGVTATLGGNAEVAAGGALSGGGQVTVSTGRLTLDVGSTAGIGSYHQEGTGTLVLQVAGVSSFASLAVAGLAQLSGGAAAGLRRRLPAAAGRPPGGADRRQPERALRHAAARLVGELRPHRDPDQELSR
jgi:hypothetical protein